MLLLAILVIALIGVSSKLLTGGNGAVENSSDTNETVIAIAQGDNVTAAAAGAAHPPTVQGDGTDQGQTPRITAQPAPTYANGAKTPTNQPGISAAAYAVLDVGTNQILLASNDSDQRPIASLTKMMTGLLVAEAGDMAHLVEASEVAAAVEPNKDGLIIGNLYPRGILLYSALLGSNNDAAAALGEDLGGTYGSFYRMMNRRAKQLGMTNTRYASSSGLNDDRNYSTARDQTIMLARALENPLFARVTRTQTHRVRWPDDGKSRTYENHNDMLQTYRGTIGGKTGFTTIASGCLAVAVTRGNHTLIGVVLGTRDIWRDMQRLLDAGFKRTA